MMANRARKIITIITISFQDEEGLLRTLRSVSGQAGLDVAQVEHIIVDGGSSYDIQSVRSAFPHVALISSEPDRGIYDAMNKGIGLASGNWILFLNSGDVLAEGDTLQSLMPSLNDEQLEFIYGDSLDVLEDGRIEYKRARHLRWRVLGMFTHHQSMIYSAKVLKDHAITYNRRYLLASDYDFTLRYLEHVKRARKLMFPVCAFQAGGVTHLNRTKSKSEQDEIRKAFFQSIILSAAVQLIQSSTHFLKLRNQGLYYALRRAMRLM